jgi:CRP-like cAMP-binding protein
MIDDGLDLQSALSLPAEGGSPDEPEEGVTDAKVPISLLIAGSDLFRQVILGIPTDPVYCALEGSSLAILVSRDQLRALSQGGREVREARTGSIVYSSTDRRQQWFVLISGTLRLTLESATLHDGGGEGRSSLILQDEVFGGFDLLEDGAEESDRFEVEVLEPCHLVELAGEALEQLMDQDQETATDIYDVLGGFCLPVRALPFLSDMV